MGTPVRTKQLQILGEHPLIFLTIGTQLPFDRLVEALDSIACDLDEEIFAQIGQAKYRPKNFDAVKTLSPTEFKKTFENARVVVAHAGIGTVLSGKKLRKPLVLMARQSKLGEHRNDHQNATAKQLRSVSGVYLFENATQLKEHLIQPSLIPMNDTQPPALDALINRLRSDFFQFPSAM